MRFNKLLVKWDLREDKRTRNVYNQILCQKLNRKTFKQIFNLEIYINLMKFMLK